jgi:hypothetical protein
LEGKKWIEREREEKNGKPPLVPPCILLTKRKKIRMRSSSPSFSSTFSLPCLSLSDFLQIRGVKKQNKLLTPLTVKMEIDEIGGGVNPTQRKKTQKKRNGKKR